MSPSDYRATFAERGGAYDDAMGSEPQARDEEFAFVLGLADPSPPCRLLDAPAGGGYLAEHLPTGVEYVALESASSFAARCRDRGLTVIEDDISAPSVAGATFDAVVSVAGVHHESDLSAVLAAWRRLLRPGGRVVVADVAQGSDVATFLDGFVGVFNTSGHAGHYLGADLATLAEQAGFDAPRVVDGAYHWWFADEHALGRYCRRLFGLDGVTDEEIVEAARHRLGIDVAPDGRVGLRWGLRAVVAAAPEATD